MTFAPLETQKTVFETLSGDSALMVLLGSSVGGTQKIFDHVPDNTIYPYVTLYVLPWTDRGNYTLEGLESEFQINVWYREPGRGNKEVQTIQKRIDELLHKQEICIDGWNIVSLRRSFVDIATSEDNVTKQGIQRFKLLIGES